MLAKKDIKLYNVFKDYWAGMTNPGPAHDTPEWFNDYACEVYFFLEGNKTIIDTGCGSGEIIVRIHKYFDRIIAIDYSEKMILKAKKHIAENNIKNVEFHTANILNIDQIIHNKVDCIFNAQVIQYLTIKQTEDFIIKCKKLLNPNGSIILMYIPDLKCRDLQAIEFFKNDSPVSFKKLIFDYLRFRFYVFKNKIKNPDFAWDKDIGLWHSKDEFKEIAIKHNLTIRFYYSICPPLGYRFHVKFKINENDDH